MAFAEAKKDKSDKDSFYWDALASLGISGIYNEKWDKLQERLAPKIKDVKDYLKNN